MSRRVLKNYHIIQRLYIINKTSFQKTESKERMGRLVESIVYNHINGHSQHDL